MEKIWANSGDSHYIEPDGFWDLVLPAALAERMPRAVKDPDGLWETVYVDGTSFRRQIPTTSRKKGADGMTLVERNLKAPGGRDINLRLADMDGEGVWGEVVYPSLGLWNGLIRDAGLLAAAARGSNDWVVSEFFGRTNRLVVPAQLSLLDLDSAVAEIERAAGIGFRAVLLPITPQEGVADLNDDSWEPLWSVISAAGLVVTFHIGFSSGDLATYRGPGGALMNWVDASYGGQRAVFKLVSAGVLDRHPNIKVLVSEGGASWVPFLGDRMNEAYRQLGTFVRPKLSMLPKEFLYRQVYASFQHDESAVPALTGMGYNNVIWGSDYPHVEGTFGHTQETLHELFDDQPVEVRERVTIGAFLDLFPEVGPPPQSRLAASMAAG